jgi:PAS domain S-box-containing protein
MQEIKHPNFGQVSQTKYTTATPPTEVLANIWDAVNCGIFVLDVVDGVEFYLSYANSAFLKISQISAEQMLSKNMQEIFNLDIINNFYTVVNSGDEITLEEQLLTGSEDNWVSLTITPVKKPNLSCNQLIITVFDLTQKKSSKQISEQLTSRKLRIANEAALLQQEEQYRSIFQTVSDGLMIAELETNKVVEVNPSVHQMHGYSYNEFLELSVFDWIHPSNHKLLEKFMEEMNINGEFACQGVDVRKDGSTFDVDVKGTLCMYNGKPHILTIIRDISKHKAAEEAQKIAQARLEYLIAESPGIIYSCSAEASEGHALNFISPNSSSVLGYEAEEFIKNPTVWMNCIHPEDMDAFMAVMPKLIAHGRHVHEYRFRHKDGNYRWIHDEVKIIKDEFGKPLEIVGHSFDVTQRRTAEEQLQHQAAELAAALKELQRTQTQIIQAEKMSSLGQLVAGVAHEINNPVSFIYSNLEPAKEYIDDILSLMELYQQQYPNPTSQIQDEIQNIDLEFIKTDLPKLLSSMKIGADRIKKIVLSLRNFSRMDESEYKSVNLHEGIDSTLIILEHRLKAQPSRLAIEVTKEYTDLPPVECCAGQINQVFMNILVNALDALDERDSNRSIEEVEKLPSRITITTKLVDSHRVSLQITDNAPGIPVEVQKRLFEPFFTTKPVGKGTGMGLSISYQIITERHGGSLECISSPGKGSTFIITIPLKQI